MTNAKPLFSTLLLLIIPLHGGIAIDVPGARDCHTEAAGCRFHGDCCHAVPDRRAAMDPRLECVDASNLGVQLRPAATGWETSSVWLIQSCPDESHADALACRSGQGRTRSIFDPLRLPAMSTDGLLFRSGHCAQCNGRARLLQPRVSVMCESGWQRSNASSPEQRSRYLRAELVSGRDLPEGCLVGTRFSLPAHRCDFFILDRCRNISASKAEQRDCEDGGFSPVLAPCGVFRNAACRDCGGDCQDAMFSGFPYGGNSVLSNVVDFWIPLKEARRGQTVEDSDSQVGFAGPDNATNPAPNSTTKNVRDAEIQSTDSPLQLVLIVTYSLSIASLILLLAVYALLPHLRNRSGQLLMSHSASVMGLQAAQLVSMCAGSLLGSGCVALHFLFYFCLVSAFVWALLFGWDLLKTFASLLRNSAFKPSRYGRFALIGWGVPLALTGLLVGLHLSIGLLDTDRGCRYRSDRVAFNLGLSFAPLVAVLLFNVVIVCLLAAQLVKTYKETRTAGQNTASKLCVMTAKVSVIMGVAWLPYFLVAIAGVSSDAVKFVAELLCSLHGGLLALGFTGNRRVRARLSKMTSSVLKTSSSSDAVSASRMAVRKSQDIRSQAPLVQASTDRSAN